MDYEAANGSEGMNGDTGISLPTSASATASPLMVAAATAAPTGPIPLTPGADNVLVLPAGVTLDNLTVQGRDLVIHAADGTTYIIHDGAVFVPTLVIDGVSVPPLNLAALLIGAEIQPAAGAVQSSGNNFADPVGDIQDAYNLGDLLPYTELAFGSPSDQEVIPGVDSEPTSLIINRNSPFGAALANDAVNEAGLPARGSEPAGSTPSSSLTTVTGTLVYISIDGVQSITVNGVVVTSVGQTIPGAHGTLTITSITDGTVGYSYVLGDNALTDPGTEPFVFVVTDPDGDAASATLTISIVDDVPTARADVDTVAAGTFGPELGNVMTGSGTAGGTGGAGTDTQGADGASLTRVASTNVPANTDTSFDGSGNLQVSGQYGVLTIKANGDYSYVRNAGTPGGVQDVFNYTLTDGDGDTSSATLTINIGDSLPAALILTIDNPEGAVNATSSVNEAGLPPHGGLPAGSAEIADGIPNNNSNTGETTAGTITYTALDSLQSVTINGTAITTVGQTFTSAKGVLTITTIAPGSIGYTYSLTTNTSGNTTHDDFAVAVTDLDGDVVNATLTINIVDDVPTARADIDVVSAGTYGPETGNAITGTGTSGGTGGAGSDTLGADGSGISSITSVNVPANTDNSFDGSGNLVINGQYGVLSISANGDYSYVRNAGTPGGVADVFSYTLTDGDTDTSNTTLTINIADSGTTLHVPTAGGGEGGGGEAGTQVSETGLPPHGLLPAGSGEGADGNPNNNSNTSETTAGTITYTAPDSPATITINGTAVTAVNQTFTTATGVLTITSIASGTIGYSYTLTTNTNGNNTHDDFAVGVTDADGDHSDATLVINIIDDMPTARMDVDSLAAGTFGPETGNVITGTGTADGTGGAGTDTLGADGASITGIASVNVGGSDTSFDGFNNLQIAGQYGTLTIKANGDYSYVRNAGTPGGVSDVFNYTLTDGDGDNSNATLTINIADSTPTILNLTPKASGGDVSVDEDDLPAGSDTSKETLVGAGNFTVNSPDGIAALAIGGHAIITGGIFTATSWTTALGNTLSVTSFNAATGVVSYTYTLNIAETHPTANGENQLFEDFSVLLTDFDGDIATSTLSAQIIDDVPTARADADTLAAGTSGPELGNVITGTGTTGGTGGAGADTKGADGASVTAIASVNVGGSDNTFDGSSNLVINGQYGVLSIKANGDYSYVRNAGTPGGVSDVFNYTLTDSDGDTSNATLTITLTDALPLAGTVSATLDDDALTNGIVGGTNDDSPDTSGTAGNLIGSGGDGALGFQFLTTGVVETGGAAGFTYEKAPNGNDLMIKQGGTLVITVTLNPANGAYTITQNAPLLHANGATENNQTFAITYNVTDIDGDVAPGSLVINVDDDTPTATVVQGEREVSLLTVDETILGTDASANLAGLFDTAYGADGAGSKVYSLGINAAPNGLVDTATNLAVVLSVNGSGQVEGRAGAGGPVVFLLTVNASGVVTLDQQRAVKHPDTTNPDDGVSLNGFVSLTVTVTDKDGDPASATTDIGQLLRFEDDGPSISASAQQPTLIVDDTTLGANAVASFASVFTPTYGADGAGSIGGYKLGVIAGPSGIVDVATGEAVNLSITGGGVIEGRITTGNTLVFTLTVDANGSVTLDQIRAVQHNDPADANELGASAATLSSDNLITLTATVTDKDGDTATATANIGQNLQFQDDGPSIIGVQATVYLDDENAAATYAPPNFGGTDDYVGAPVGTSGTLLHNFGADGAGSVLLTGAGFATYTGGPGAANSFAQLVTGGGTTLEIYQYQEAGPIKVMTVTVTPATGTYTVVQNNPIDHLIHQVPEEQSLFSVQYKVTDADGDTATGMLPIDVDDDTPWAVNDTACVVEGRSDDANYNVAFVLDFSGSIDNAELNTQLDAVRAAGQAIFAGTNGTVSIRIVGFASTAADFGVFTDSTAFTNAINALNPLEAGGSRPGGIGNNTDYTAAIETLMGVFTPSLTANNQVFFLSDGQPNEQTGTGALSNTLAPLWNTFVDTNGINVTAIGVGNGIDTGPLQDIDVDGSGAPILIANFEALVDTLLQQVNGLTISGDLDPNDSYGADGGHINSITVPKDGPDVTYTWNGLSGAASQITVSDGGATITGQTSITTSTELGGIFTFNFTNGQWSYTPPADVPATTIEVFNYSIVDGDGDPASAALTITIKDDPTPSIDRAAATFTVDEDGLTGGIPGGTGDVAGEVTTQTGTLAGMSFGGDGPGNIVLTAVADTGLRTLSNHVIETVWDGTTHTLTGRDATAPGTIVFTMQITDVATGAYEFKLLAPIKHTDPASEDDKGLAIGVTVTDADGDAATGTVNVTIDDDSPTITGVQATVYLDDENAAATYAPPNFGGTDDYVGAPVGTSGTLLHTFGADGAGSVLLTGAGFATYTGGPGAANSFAQLVTGGGTTLEIYQYQEAGPIKVMTVTVTPATGTYTVVQNNPIDHLIHQVPEEQSLFSVQYKVTDADGDTATGMLPIDVDDDTPWAVNDTACVVEGRSDDANYNVAFVLDFSGSIDNAELNTQLDAVRAAGQAIFAGTNGTVSIRIVGFASTAADFGVFTDSTAFTNAINALNPLEAGGSRPGGIGNNTDYTAAIETLMGVFTPSLTANNQVFFLSDGQPNEQTGTGALSNTLAPLWNTFVDTNGINVTAIGVGNGIDTGPLQDIDVDGSGAPILIANFEALVDTLLQQVNGLTISGDLDPNDSYGADGGHINSITVPKDGPDVTYTWNGLSGAASQITVSDGGATITGQTSITTSTELGGIFTFNFTNGQWSYTPPADVPATTIEVFNYSIVDGDGDPASAALTITIKDDPTPSIDRAAATFTVDEDGLTGGIPGGTGDVAGEVTTQTGTLAGMSFGGDGPGNIVLTAVADTGLRTLSNHVIETVWDGTTHTLTGRDATAPGTIVFTMQITDVATGAYEFKLLAPIKHTDPASEDDKGLAIGVTVTDADGDAATGTVNVTIDDDSPVAYADTNAVGEGATVLGNVLTDGTDDVFGADGPTSPGAGVVGVATGSNTAAPVAGGLGGLGIAGTYGTLTLNANGTYSYKANANIPTGTPWVDHFVYTIKDGDGDTSTTTLDITVNNVTVTASDTDALVNEAGLATGSNAAANSEIANGSITPAGGTGPYTYTLTSPAAGSHGNLVLNANGTYTYTLTTRYDTNPDLDNSTQTEQDKDSFSYTVTDANGNTATGTILVDIVDDVPTAYADTNAVGEGATVLGNVLTDGTDDVFGADGPTSPGAGVVGVATGSNTAAPVAGGLGGLGIAGTYGTLTLNANGTYSYKANANIPTGTPWVDHFVYTIKDGDGDTSTTTLDITVNNVTVTASDTDALVNEAGLATGSNAAANSEIANGSITPAGGTGPYTYTLTSPAAGSHGNLVLNANGTYTYTLTTRYDTNPDLDNSTQTEQDKDSFSYTVTDANGNTATGTILVDIVDDVPTALVDTAMTVAENAGVTNGTNLLANDVAGADGIAKLEISFDGGTNWSTVLAGGTTITPAGGQGTYVFQTSGAWTFDPIVNASVSSQNGSFSYRITDGDGDTSVATQTVTITNVDSPLLIVGSSAGDIVGTTDDHTVPNPNGPIEGAIVGGSLDDKLVGDPGAVTLTPGQTANVVLVLDSSGSMDAQISFDGGTITRMQALKNGVNALIDNLSETGAQNIRITIIDFDSIATNRGTFNLIVNGVVNAAQVTAAHNAVALLNDEGGTNYEIGLQSALSWINGANGIAGAQVNKVVFVSDGEPNEWVGASSGGSGATEAMNQVLGALGATDNTNEPALILATGYSIDSIGINIGATGLGYLGNVEDGTAAVGPGVAQNVTTAEQLATSLSVLGGSTALAAAGNDNISGGTGNDIIFGDVLYTDTLAASLGGVAGLAPGSGWAVLQTLEQRANNESQDPAGNGADWTRADTVAYIAANHLALSAESGRTGGNDIIDAGDGNDIIYGQEGNDTIAGGIGDDTIDGGSGADQMTGGAGDDIFQFQSGDVAAGETINGGADTDTIKVLTTTDFTNLGATALRTTNAIERILVTSGQAATFTGAQLTAQLIAINATAAAAATLNVNVTGTADLSTLTFASFGGNDAFGGNDLVFITGSGGVDTITGTSLADSISAGAGNDIIVGAQTDTLLDGGADTDTLQIGANFNDASNAQVNAIENIVLTAAAVLDLSSQTEGFAITGSAGADSITGGGGADTIVGADNDTLLDGGGGIDTLQVGGNFTSTGNAQIANIENVTLTAAAVLNLSNQAEGFTITGSAGIDSITGGAGADTIVGAQADTLLSGGGGTDTLQIGANFTSSNDGHVVGIENVSLTAAATLNLANQTEAFTITGSAGVDTITGGAGGDSISAGGGNDIIVGAQNDTLLDGGANTDTLHIGANFDDTGNGQIVNIENVLLTATANVNLASQTEVLNITGSAGADTITAGSANDFVRGGGGADTLALSAGGDDTIRFEATAATNGVDIITGFDAGASGDIINLNLTGITAGLEAGAGFSGTITAYVHNDSGQNDDNDSLSNRVAVVATGSTFTTANSTSQIANLFNGSGVDPFSLAASQKGVLLTGSAGSQTVYVWFIENDGTTAVIDTEVRHVATITLQAGEDIDDLHADNFDFDPIVPPIVFDLDGDGAEFLSLTAGVTFDYANDGNADGTAWAGADDGILAVDLGGDGAITSASEFVFGGNGLTDLQGLALVYDSNHDGVLDAADASFAQFGVWQDANSNGVSEAGEFRSLAEMGITSVKLTSDGASYDAANGDVVVHGTTTYTRADGSTGTAADASFATDADRQARTADLAAVAAAASGVVAASIVAASAAPEASAAPAPSADDSAAASASLAQDAPASAEAPGDAAALLGSAAAAPLAPQSDSADAGDDSAVSTDLTAPADHGSAPAPADQAAAQDSPADQAGAFDFGGGGDHLMDALLAANIAVPAEAPAADALVAVQDALGDTVAVQAVDAVIDHFAGTEAASAPAPASDPAGLQSLLLAHVGPADPGFHAMPPIVDDHSAALAAA